MKALVIHGAKDLRLSKCERGELGPGQVRLRVSRGGICGTDLHYFRDGGFGAIRLREPMILGHEISAHVIETAPEVKGLTLGDLVAVCPSRPCGQCSLCLEGLANHCSDMRFYGSAMRMPHVQGAFRQEFVALASQCVPAAGLSPAEAAMAEPLAVCLHGARIAGNMVGKRVLITGSGPIGVLIGLVARRAGAAEIVVSDILDKPLEFARACGADKVINTALTRNGLAPYQTGKGYFDLHFECSGAAPALAAGICATRPRGVIVQLGMSSDMTIPMQQITVRELSLRGSFRFHEEFALAVEMMQKQLIDVKPLLTRTFPLDDYSEAFKLALDKQQSMKVQLDFA